MNMRASPGRLAAQPVILGIGGSAGRPRVLLPVHVAPLPPPKRARAKLWELNESVHCSIIGTCLTTAELRRVMGKALPGDVSRASDHDLHSQAVGLGRKAHPRKTAR